MPGNWVNRDKTFPRHSYEIILYELRFCSFQSFMHTSIAARGRMHIRMDRCSDPISDSEC